MKELEGETLFQIDAKMGDYPKRREILYPFIEPLDSFYLKRQKSIELKSKLALTFQSI